MAKPIIGMRDLMPRTDRLLRPLAATSSLDGAIQFKLKSLPSSEILNKFQNAINRASERIAVDLKSALDEAIRSPIWSGQDIVDSGQLLNSGTVTVGPNGVTVAYDAPYAALVHYGGYIHPYGKTSSRVYLPPRPWMESVIYGGAGLQPFDFVSYYTQEITAEFRS